MHAPHTFKQTTCWKANANMVQRVLMVPTWLWRLLVSNMHDGAAEATLGRDWGYTLCLCGHGERWQRRWFTYKANWTTCRDNKFNKLRICRLTTDTTTSMLIEDQEWSVNKNKTTTTFFILCNYFQVKISKSTFVVATGLLLFVVIRRGAGGRAALPFDCVWNVTAVQVPVWSQIDDRLVLNEAMTKN